ncbi:MAG: hypothetical protein EBX50_03950 [Chitinophagia bacterium]|nr:hypothetical protein [Chitinophagia bacterium]
MKKYLFFFLLLQFHQVVIAQVRSDYNETGFPKTPKYFGSGLNLGVSGRSFNLGINPELGFSVSRWLDAGFAVNFNYYSQNASEFSNFRYKNINYGAGVFARIWPVNFIFLQIQPEYNWIISSQKNVTTQQTDRFNYSAESMLVGIGYGTRMVGSRISYVSLMIDVLQNPNSPYRDAYNDQLPVLRAGFGVYLRPNR